MRGCDRGVCERGVRGVRGVRGELEEYVRGV